MTKLNRLKDKIRRIPKDFTFSELKKLLIGLGYTEYSKGKTSGSRVRFYREADGSIIDLHKPHPGNEVKMYALRQVVDVLKKAGDL